MKILKYETNFKKKLYFNETNRRDEKLPERFENELINLYPDVTYQEFLGFGGAITEASGYCYSKLSSERKSAFIDAYYSTSGLNYSLARLPIGSTDFSLDAYSYSYKKDLSDFSIEKDRQYILPLIKAAQEKASLTFFASPWSPPKFMKNTKMLSFGGKLRDKYKPTMANYFVNYINSYKNEGINISFVTVQNEPNAIQSWESCIYTSYEEAEFVVKYLYPTFIQHNISAKILVWDNNKESLFTRAQEEFSVEGALNAISGLAYHYYSKDHFENIKLVRDFFPNKLLIHTEGCTGFSDINAPDEFKNGEIYAHDIIGDLNAGANGYIDWNILLDSKRWA